MILTRRHFFIALVLSALAHLVFVAGSEISLPDLIQDSQDEVLEAKKGGKVPKVKLRISANHQETTAARPETTRITLIRQNPPEVAKQVDIKAHPKRKPKKPVEAPPPKQLAQESIAATPPVEAPAMQPSDAAIDHVPAEAPPTVITPPTESIPTFPESVRSLYRATYYGIPVELRQTWELKGNHYSIESNASKFGYKFRVRSEGQISEQGLLPGQFKVYVNNLETPKKSAEFSYQDQTLRLGSPDSLVAVPFVQGTQDLASFPYHLAVTFSGNESLTLSITTGNAMYEVRFTLVGEETLKLPAGTLRTLHLRGSRQRAGSSDIQDGYEVWLAPDFSNFPVKMRGPDSRGKMMETSLKTLEFSGKTVIGKDLPPEEDTGPKDILTELLKHQQYVPAPANSPAETRAHD